VPKIYKALPRRKILGIPIILGKSCQALQAGVLRLTSNDIPAPCFMFPERISIFDGAIYNYCTPNLRSNAFKSKVYIMFERFAYAQWIRPIARKCDTPRCVRLQWGRARINPAPKPAPNDLCRGSSIIFPTKNYIETANLNALFCLVVDTIQSLPINLRHNQRPLSVDGNLCITVSGFSRCFASLSSFLRLSGLLGNGTKGQDDSPSCRPDGPSEKAIPTWRVPFGVFYVFLGMLFISRSRERIITVCGFLCAILGSMFILNGYVGCQREDNNEYRQVFPHNF